MSMSEATTEPTGQSYDYDVVIIGGGPAGCSAGVFIARYDLDLLILDRGRSSIQQCAYLENYLGFPAGIDIETLYALMHDHAEEAGCEIISDLAESVDYTDDGDGFIVETQEDQRVTAGRIISATSYGGEYLRPLDGDAMFERYEHEGEEYERFDQTYADTNGETPVDDLYVVSPSEEASRQAIMAAGRGARVGLTLLENVRQERDLPTSIAGIYDWMHQETELNNEWGDRDRWREWFDKHISEDHDLDEERRVTLRETEIDRRLTEYISRDAIDQRTRRGHDRLLDHIDNDRILEYAQKIEAERHPTGGSNRQ